MNLATILESHPDSSPALVSRSKTTTYGQLRGQVAALAAGLAGLGVGPGDRVALVSVNNWFFVVGYLAVLGVGAVVVPLNPASPTAELERQLAVTRPTVVVVGPAAGASVTRIDRVRLGLDHIVAPASAGLEATTPLEDLFAASAEQGPLSIVDRGDDELAVLMFTSGTAGAPKAAMLTHGNLRSNLEQVQAHPGRAIRADDVVLGVLPPFHIFGLNVVLGLTLYVGASVVLVERFDPITALETIASYGVTVVPGAPPMFTAWLGLPAPDPRQMAGVRLAVSGGAALAPEIAQAFEKAYGLTLYQGYGLTEAAPTVTSSLAVGRARAASIGVPLPGVEVRLVDRDGEEALQGDPGEIWVRGPNVFAGYWEEPEASAAALTLDGWLRTGDLAVADDEGLLYLAGRTKELINVSGFNVYPGEVEDALLEHPGVAQAAVVGVPHPHTGEAVKAFVVAVGSHHLEEDELIEFCCARLARYKAPTKIVFVDELPVGLAGKILRRELR